VNHCGQLVVVHGLLVSGVEALLLREKSVGAPFLRNRKVWLLHRCEKGLVRGWQLGPVRRDILREECSAKPGW